ncbi:MAG: sulfatase-like hydrolase/transferase [Ginsengibacter sp.]
MNSLNKPIVRKRLRTARLLCAALIITSLIMNNAWSQKSLSKKKSNTGSINLLAENSKPNIIWITTEGVPLRVLSCYGSSIMKTPNIDRIAKEGMLFKNSFCNNALCAPSRNPKAVD